MQGIEKDKGINMDRGTQIIYVPAHADGDINHPDCETGFVTSVRYAPGGDFAFCRYWNKDGELRTRANSEATPIDLVVVQDTIPQEKIEVMLQWIEYND